MFYCIPILNNFTVTNNKFYVYKYNICRLPKFRNKSCRHLNTVPPFGYMQLFVRYPYVNIDTDM